MVHNCIGDRLSDYLWIIEKISAGWLVLFTLPLYIGCCLVTNYGNLFNDDTIVGMLGNGYYELTGLYFFSSFPVALFWMALGRFLAERKIDLKSEACGQSVRSAVFCSPWNDT